MHDHVALLSQSGSGLASTSVTELMRLCAMWGSSHNRQWWCLAGRRCKVQP